MFLFLLILGIYILGYISCILLCAYFDDDNESQNGSKEIFSFSFLWPIIIPAMLYEKLFNEKNILDNFYNWLQSKINRKMRAERRKIKEEERLKKIKEQEEERIERERNTIHLNDKKLEL